MKNRIALGSLLFLGILIGGNIHASNSCGSPAPKCSKPESLTFNMSSQTLRVPGGEFTQGLEYHNGVLYESTGAPDLNGKQLTTKINTIDMKTGKTKTLIDQGSKIFGEGLTVFDGQIHQLTWKNNRILSYDLTGKPLSNRAYPREGWGLTNDGNRLISSDGSDRLTLFDPKSPSGEVTAKDQICVREKSKFQQGDEDWKVKGLNELEYVNGKIFSNIFGSDDVVRIDPETGCVDGRIQLAGLRRAIFTNPEIPQELRDAVRTDPNYVLNGIAFDDTTGEFTFTGKNWPMIFKGKVVVQPPVIAKPGDANCQPGKDGVPGSCVHRPKPKDPQTAEAQR